jgi:TPR repeat protein
MQIMQHEQDAVQKNTRNFQFDFTEFERGQKLHAEDINTKLISAECYLKGDGIKKDIDQGRKLLEDVIEKNRNNPIVELKLAMLFIFCKEIEQNRIRAIEWFEKVISHDLSLPLGRQAEVQARTMLGICYYYEYKDNDLALECFSDTFREKHYREGDDSVRYLWMAFIYQLKNWQQFEGSNIECYQQPWWHPTHSENIHAKYSQQDIDKLLCRAAAGFFLKDDGYNYTDPDIINFIFPENFVIEFLENQNFSYAKVILAFYYQCKNEKEKFLELLEKAHKENNIIASYELGKYYKELNYFDEAIKYFNSIEQRKNSPFNKEKDYYHEKDINQWLALLAVEELKSIDSIKHLKELEEKNIALELKIQQNESLQNRMQKMVQEFTHTLSNVIFPDIIYQVSESLKKTGGNRKDILLLQQAYYSEKLIKLLGEILRLRYANPDPEHFRQTIRGCRLESDNGNAKTIEDILDYALSRVVARFINQDDASLKGIREQALAVKGSNLENLKHSFEDSVLLNNTLSSIEWTTLNLLPIKITEISPLWKNIFIQSENYTEALMFSYFSEILFNAFKYSNHGNDEFLTISFNECSIDNQIYLSCNFSNPAVKNNPLSLGTGVGLDAIKEDLYQLNDTDEAKKSLLVSKQDRQFQVTLFLQKDLLYIEPLSEQDYDMFL